MKKFFLGLLLFVFLVLTVLYLALNSPWLIDKIARKFAPEYGFDYRSVHGNPLRGIVLEDLRYRGEKLAGEIKLRINPYTLVERELTVSRLEVLDVNVSVLERMIRDFTATDSSYGSGSQESGGGLPLAVQVNDIRLSLLPFERYGVKVTKELLSVDSIYYAGESFSVGRLRQIAETSLGRIELEGTYRRRFLDVDFLVVDELDLPRLEQLITTLGLSSEENATVEKSASVKMKSTAVEKERSTTNTGEDIFLPKRIRAGRVWVSLLPYEPIKGVKLEWTQLEGKALDIDLEHSRIVSGALTTDLQSNLAQVRLKLHVDKGDFIIDEGLIEDLDPGALATLGEKNSTQTPSDSIVESEPEEANASVVSYDTLPFVPRYMQIHRLRVEFKPGEFQRLSYRAAVAKIKNLSLDLHEQRLQTEALEAYLDTPLAHADLAASVDSDTFRIKSLILNEVDPEKIIRWEKDVPALHKTTQKKVLPQSSKQSGVGIKKKKGIEIPFLPSRLEVDRALFEFRPFHLDPLDTEGGRVLLEKLRIDLAKEVAERGALRILLDSNLADVKLLGTIRNNRLTLDPRHNRIVLPPSLFSTYRLPLRSEAFSPVALGGSIDETGVKADLSFSAEKILPENNESNRSFNIDIDHSKLHFDFDFSDGEFRLTDDTLLVTPQAPLTLHVQLGSDGKGGILYQGFLKTPGVKLGDSKLEKLLGKPVLDFRGDMHSLFAKMEAGVFAGNFHSDDLKKGLLKFGTKKEIEAARYVKLPKALRKTVLQLHLSTPVDFAKPLPLRTYLSLHSNIADLKGTVYYDGNVSSEIAVHFPEKSLLKKSLPALNISALDPLKITLDQKDSRWRVNLKNRKLDADLLYEAKNGNLQGAINLSGSKITIEGKPQETIRARLHSDSVKNMIRHLTEIYRIELPRLDGDVDLILKIDKLSKIDLELKSDKFVPDADARIKNPIEEIDVVMGADLKTKTLLLKRYSLKAGGMKIFATKVSRIKLENDRLKLEALWINDSLKASGFYDLKKRRGEIVAKSRRFRVVHENAMLDASVDLKTKLDGEKVDVSGKIVILGGKVMYDIAAKHYATDDDIVILQHRKKGEESSFKKNVQLTIYIETKKPLIFKQKNVYVQLIPQMSILKSFHGDLQVLGSVKIPKGGYYTFEGKKFVLKESSVNFTGKPTQPLLDINLVYRRYSKTIYITVNGVATEPNLNFSSDPYMTRSQILSFILFDTEETGENADDMLSMVGGGIAKSILGNMGLKVDTLIVTSQGFEVGKKITDKITVLYDQQEENPKVIVRIQHSKHTETDIDIGSESQSVDIIYKKEF